MEKIILGLPKGSLNNVNRGNTYQLFVDAGYEVRGYEPGKEENEITILNDPEIKGFLTRPQSAPVELNRQILDLAIIGEDWVREESVNVEGELIKKVGDLDYGQTRLIVAVPNDDPYESLSEFFRANKNRETPILCFTEYPNLTRQFFMENEGYQELFGQSKPVVQIRGLKDGDNEMVQIINSDGATEVYIAKGADLVVDNTQTGSSLRKAGLKILETIMESSAGLYAGPSCTPEKAEKAKIIFEQLFGAIKARKYFDVKFNISNEKTDEVKDFLLSNEYCSDEPTTVQGTSFSQVNVLIPKNKFPQMLKGIKSFGASAIVRQDVKQYVQ
ncbi:MULTISPECIES: ATP phosphoribosyltransferase [Methanobacterium]|jgi:ATP phosphoribosyltransferase|uniref:ATP phosphoribosyltransferase n=1 Tax=Methanobacterium formicicum TaxID=2162 RepID=A0A089ZI64_METFO|nr:MULTISPECIES: ATP phosphoribosyltransferase [Methanobacterium]AIS32243.1 ATP phosphoribosyltransferase HisG2 [Methanobacterium formicicum]KUK72780.1 MAG: ATP phosphoribosyltransferase [Methanobacterium sp. 42_16]MBF4474647.1 ATP phosphoribosyltransferase [Methanobacterium formicicum]MDD4811338.1 ATP phosphoribosyltransferase [Methanobacterium formicicum]MDG3547527.1 ATP phosphoribosyltransferase [Methanobacterium formicicum]